MKDSHLGKKASAERCAKTPTRYSVPPVPCLLPPAGGLAR